MISKYKNIIIVGLILAVALIAYSILRPDPTLDSLLETTERQTSTQVLGDEITTAINQINSLKLDRSVLEDPIVQKLIDHSVPIVPEPVGRRNPFAPIGSADVFESSTSTSKINSATSSNSIRITNGNTNNSTSTSSSTSTVTR